MIDTGIEVSIIKRTREEFLKPDLYHHAWAVNTSLIMAYGH